MKTKYSRRITLLAVSLVAWSLTPYAQFIPRPSEAWVMQAEGWRFENNDYVWRYSEHDVPRQLLFTLERLTAPHLAQDNVVAWAYPISEIDRNSENWNQLLDDISNMKIALAVEASDESFLVFSGTFAQSIAASQLDSYEIGTSTDPSCLYGLANSYCNSVWAVSLEQIAYIDDRSEVRQISSWNESPLLSPDHETLRGWIESP